MNAAGKRVRYAKNKREPGGFVALPIIVIRSDQFVLLSAHAVKLLIDLLAAYNGSNNGDLACTWTMMQRRGWRSRETLAKALAELVRRGFVAQTRQGGRHASSLYGITFYALDDNAKLDIRGGEFPRGAWARGERTDGPASRYHGRRVNSAVIDTVGVSPRGAASAN